jgi:CHRD domain-containing protein
MKQEGEKMRRYLWGLAVTAAAASVLAAAAVAVAGPGQQTAATAGVRCVLNTQLRAANEPPVLSTAEGHAQLKVWKNGMLGYKVFILNRAAETFTAGHIHLTAGGGIAQGLFAGPSTTARQIRVNNTIAIDPALATALCTTPANYYVNFHTVADPVGAVRGNFTS